MHRDEKAFHTLLRRQSVYTPRDRPQFWLQCLTKNDKAVFSAAAEVAENATRCDHLSISLSDEYQTVTQFVAFPDYGELVIASASGQTVDEMGREWKRVDAFFLGSIEAKSKTYMADGTVIAHPLSQEIALIIDKLELLESNYSDLEPVVLNYEELERHLSMLQRFTAVKGRRDAHLWALLLYATPPYFQFDRERVEGWSRGLFFGDTTTGKGQAIKGIRRLLDKGQYLVAEIEQDAQLGCRE